MFKSDSTDSQNVTLQPIAVEQIVILKNLSGITNSFYINLSHRKDRKLAIENVLKASSIPFQRIEAVNPNEKGFEHLKRGCFDQAMCPGQIGCQLSHLIALKQAMESDLEHVSIFEDDFEFQAFVDPKFVQSAIQRAMELIPAWDVIILSSSIILEMVLHEHIIPVSSNSTVKLTQIQNAQTTGGYIARRRIIPYIYQAFKECDVSKDYYTAIDQCWKPLQTTYLWIGFEPQIGKQSKSFSDIELREVEYELN